MAINISFSVGNFPNGYCWKGAQPYANDLVSLLIGTVAGNFSGVIISSTAPAVSDQDKLWVRTDANGKPIGLFLFLGQWIWPNQREASGSELMIWDDTEANLWSYDGGDGTDPGAVTPTETTGAMWQTASSMVDRFPLGAGAEPQGTTGGGGGGTLLQSDLPDVALGLATGAPSPGTLAVFGGSDVGTGPVIAGNATQIDVNTVAGNKQALTTSLNGGVTQTEFTAPKPAFRAVIFARRTARVYYTAS